MTGTTGASARVHQRATTGLAVVIAATALGWLVSSPSATAAPLPPIATFPEAGETAPPPGAIDADDSDDACTDWYRQSAYFGQQTGSTWWEYSCRSEWPIIGDGATNADWSGQNISTAYFHWTGSGAAHHGTAMFDGYSDSWFTATYCDYWWDRPTGRLYGPFDLTFPGECVA